jgi:hypothetical protein
MHKNEGPINHNPLLHRMIRIIPLRTEMYCNTPGVTMAMAHPCTNDCDHMWERLEKKSITPWEPCINQEC